MLARVRYIFILLVVISSGCFSQSNHLKVVKPFKIGGKGYLPSAELEPVENKNS